MKKSQLISLPQPIIVNKHIVTHVIIGRHYLEKHSRYMNDGIIINLVLALNEKQFTPDSITSGVEYFVSDIQITSKDKIKTYRLVWLLEGDNLEIVGVVNAFRTKRNRK